MTLKSSSIFNFRNNIQELKNTLKSMQTNFFVVKSTTQNKPCQ